MRNISFTFTTPQVKAKTKTVTRRPGWAHVKPGELLCAIEKGRGLAKGEKVKKICVIQVVGVRLERLDRLLNDSAYGKREVILEGFPELSPAEYVQQYCKSHRGCKPTTSVTRIEFEYPRSLPLPTQKRGKVIH
jgi:hypothetical protein